MKTKRPFLLYSLFFLCLCGSGAAEISAQTENNSATQIAENAAAKNETVSAKEEKPVEKIKYDFPNESSIELRRVGIQTDRTVPISLNEAIRKALENNNDIEVAKTDVRIQETQLRSLQGAYEPILSLTPTFSRSSSTGSSASNDFRVNAGFDKLLERGGGRFNSFFNNSQTGRNSSNNTTFNQTSTLASSSSTTFSSNVGVTYTQPLFRDFRIDNTRRQIKIQRKRLQQSDADFRRSTIAVIAQVQNSYWDLVFALRDQQNRLANLNLAKENLRQVEAKINAGTAAPLARAEVATELANREGDVLLAAQQVSQTENTLKTLLLRDANAPEWTQAFVPTDRPSFSDEPLNVEDAMKDALDNRPELSRLRLQREINTIDIDYFRNQTKPQIDLVSSFSLGGITLGGQNTTATNFPLISGSENTNSSVYLFNRLNLTRQQLGLPVLNDIPTVTSTTLPGFLTGGSFQSLRNLFRTDAPNYSVGVTIQFPFRNRTAQANLAGARIQQEQVGAQTRAQEQLIVADVRNSVQAAETARQRILTARRARQNAEIQLEGERKLFEVGRSTTFLLFQRENALTNARNAEIRAETDYNKALSDLQRATSTTFRTNNIEVESPINNK